MLNDFYQEIYNGERHFSDGELPQFEEDDVDIDPDAPDLEGDSDDEEEDFVVEDPNRDDEAEPVDDDEPIATQKRPRKQTFLS